MALSAYQLRLKNGLIRPEIIKNNKNIRTIASLCIKTKGKRYRIVLNLKYDPSLRLFDKMSSRALNSLTGKNKNAVTNLLQEKFKHV